MAHIRIFRHYIHTPFLLTAALESVAIGFAAYTGYFTRFGEFPDFYAHLPYAISLGAMLTFFMMTMGVYEARLREGILGVALRTAVAMFLLGTLGMSILMYLATGLSEGRGVLLFSLLEAFAIVIALRLITSSIVDDDFMKRRVVVLGTGMRALKIANRMRRRSDQRAFVLAGYMSQPGTDDVVSELGVKIMGYPEQGLLSFCREHHIDEIVVASDDRRADSSNTPVPFDELMNCRLSGVEVCEVQNFIEREGCKIDVDLLQRAWLVYSDGFITSGYRAFTKRIFDVIAALVLIVFTLPLMLLTGLIVAGADRFKGPIFYRQQRIGLDGEIINVAKFRTMRVDAEDSGAVWAGHNDPRTTSIGGFLRSTHLDELPQLFSVLSGKMSMVGPRPERPVFVDYLKSHLPFYEQRHHIKPGLTGWAQLCYPYGASIEDSKEKLQYDLYYLKNHSILLDLIILFQTVEAVLVGEGAR